MNASIATTTLAGVPLSSGVSAGSSRPTWQCEFNDAEGVFRNSTRPGRPVVGVRGRPPC